MVDYSLLYDPGYYDALFEQKHFVEKELSYQSYENAFIVPFLPQEKGLGVYTQEKEYISDGNTCVRMKPDAKRKNLNLDDSIDYCDETVIFFGITCGIWGHVITDFMKRFWFLKSNYYHDKFKDCRIVMLNLTLTETSKVYELLSILGLDKSKYTIVNNITRFKKVIIPDNCFFHSKRKSKLQYIYNDFDEYNVEYTREYVELINIVGSWQAEHYKSDKSCEKMYFSQSKYAKAKGNLGEEKLDKFFEKQGYKVVHPEEHTFKELLNMLANCHYFASTLGSGALNWMFLPEHANVVCIPRTYDMDEYMLGLFKIKDFNLSIIDSSLSVGASHLRPTAFGPMYYYVSENLMRYFGVDVQHKLEFYKEQFADFEEYLWVTDWKTGVDGKERFPQRLPKFYADQLLKCMEYMPEFKDVEMDIECTDDNAEYATINVKRKDYINDYAALQVIVTNEKFLIYGKGRVAKVVISQCSRERTEAEAILLTDAPLYSEYYMGIPVYGVKEYAGSDSLFDKAIIVCTLEKYHYEIKRELEKYQVGKVYYVGGKLYKDIETMLERKQ